MNSPLKTWKGVNIFHVYFTTHKQITMNRYFIFEDYLNSSEIKELILEHFPKIQEIKYIEEWGPALEPIIYKN